VLKQHLPPTLTETPGARAKQEFCNYNSHLSGYLITMIDPLPTVPHNASKHDTKTHSISVIPSSWWHAKHSSHTHVDRTRGMRRIDRPTGTCNTSNERRDSPTMYTPAKTHSAKISKCIVIPTESTQEAEMVPHSGIM
jgi:hypothetical protein